MGYRKLLVSLLFIPALAFSAESETSLFSSTGDAVAYIALSDDLTIYLWEGKPAAYLTEDSAGGHHVYGFNGKHLGWFVNGIIRDHVGDTSCGIKEVMTYTQIETFKGFKQFKPFKAFKEFAPFRPFFFNNFSQIPCGFLLGTGTKN